ncbi:hypothetical protein L3Q82_013623, partial [Scortum barcoo]
TSSCGVFQQYKDIYTAMKKGKACVLTVLQKVFRERARLTKLRRDCQYISQQVFKLHLELEEEQSFSSLRQVVEEEEQKRKDKHMRSNISVSPPREAKRELEQRKQSLLRQKEEIQQKMVKLKNMDELAADLMDKLYETSSTIANKNRIMEKATELQLLQTQKESSQTEKLLEEKLQLLHKQLKEETRVHEESEKFLKNQHKFLCHVEIPSKVALKGFFFPLPEEELQQQLQQWQQRTKRMLQEKEQQLNSVCCKRTVNLDRLMEMRRKFREMEQVVMEDREEQEKLRQQQEEVKAATKLQAWWRGCMVRRGLGSFKKAEEVKKGKKKKEGKKKKK